MNLTVDARRVSPDEFGLTTVGDLLRHVRGGRRLVVSLTIDGVAPDFEDQDALQSTALAGREVAVETSDQSALALEALEEVPSVIEHAVAGGLQAAQALEAGQIESGMALLSNAFDAWRQARDAAVDLAQLADVELDALSAGPVSFTAAIQTLTEQLRSVRQALGDRDLVALSDVLRYELPPTGNLWREAVASLQATVALKLAA